jgi:hypothetical protein
MNGGLPVFTVKYVHHFPIPTNGLSTFKLG